MKWRQLAAAKQRALKVGGKQQQVVAAKEKVPEVCGRRRPSGDSDRHWRSSGGGGRAAGINYSTNHSVGLVFGRTNEQAWFGTNPAFGIKPKLILSFEYTNKIIFLFLYSCS